MIESALALVDSVGSILTLETTNGRGVGVGVGGGLEGDSRAGIDHTLGREGSNEDGGQDGRAVSGEQNAK